MLEVKALNKCVTFLGFRDVNEEGCVADGIVGDEDLYDIDEDPGGIDDGNEESGGAESGIPNKK